MRSRVLLISLVIITVIGSYLFVRYRPEPQSPANVDTSALPQS